MRLCLLSTDLLLSTYVHSFCQYSSSEKAVEAVSALHVNIHVAFTIFLLKLLRLSLLCITKLRLFSSLAQLKLRLLVVLSAYKIWVASTAVLALRGQLRLCSPHACV